MIRIAIAGGPGSGKSSLARMLTTELYNRKQLNAQFVSEFARDYINEAKARSNGTFQPSLADQQLIFDTQIEREDVIPKNVEFIICDSPIFLPVIFAANLCDFTNFQQRTIYLRMYGTFLANHSKRYDHVFVVQRQKDFLKDGTRNETVEEADLIGRQTVAFLQLHQISFSPIFSADDDRRVEEAIATLGV